jgi:sugar phosphate isomerase/epimerase
MLAEVINSPTVGVAVDVYHLWWDPTLEFEIKRCGENRQHFAFPICDLNMPTTNLLDDRGIMGEGCIPINNIRT